MPHRIKAVLKAKGGQRQYYYGDPNNHLGECICRKADKDTKTVLL